MVTTPRTPTAHGETSLTANVEDSTSEASTKASVNPVSEELYLATLDRGFPGDSGRVAG